MSQLVRLEGKHTTQTAHCAQMQSTLILLIQGQDFTGQRGLVYGE